jgi:hypothetical protein
VLDYMSRAAEAIGALAGWPRREEIARETTLIATLASEERVDAKKTFVRLSYFMLDYPLALGPISPVFTPFKYLFLSSLS